MREFTETIPEYGFRIIEEKLVLKIGSEAEQYIFENQNVLSWAEMDEEDNIIITKHIMECCCCGTRKPAYVEFIYANEAKHTNPYKDGNCFVHIKKKPYKHMPLEKISSWMERQRSFLEKKPPLLNLNKPLLNNEKMPCDKCKEILPRSNKNTPIKIQTDSKKITLKIRLNLQELKSIQWCDRLIIKDLVLDSSFILFESLTFNFKKGTAYLCVTNSEDIVYAVKDITNVDINSYKQDPIFVLVEKNKKMYKMLGEEFIKQWGQSLPFDWETVHSQGKIEQYILMTRFIGYDETFYSFLPYTESPSKLNKDFLSVAKKIHDASKFKEVLEKMSWATAKSIRKIIVKCPTLLLYKNQLEILYNILGDVNLFRDILNLEHIFDELLWLYKYPALKDFYIDYRNIFGKRALSWQIRGKNEVWRDYGIYYLLLAEKGKGIERKKWNKKFQGFYTYRNSPGNMGTTFSTPILGANQFNVSSDNIDGYYIKRLISSGEYIKAGRELNNCLGSWEHFAGNVYGVIKKNRYVAAIRVCGSRIIEARIFGNGEVYEDYNLEKIVKIWGRKNNLKYCH